MTILPLVLAPDPLLKKKSLAINRVDDDIRQLMDDMYQTMKKESGIGLAAVQVGVLKRVIIIELGEEYGMDKPLFMANPEIISFSQECSVFNEGCLSFPTQRIDIERPASIKVKFLDYNNNPQEISADGLLATAIQHEMDHTNGIVISDHASRLKREMMLKRAKKIKADLV
jgi:peptide deformylase